MGREGEGRRRKKAKARGSLTSADDLPGLAHVDGAPASSRRKRGPPPLALPSSPRCGGRFHGRLPLPPPLYPPRKRLEGLVSVPPEPGPPGYSTPTHPAASSTPRATRPPPLQNGRAGRAPAPVAHRSFLSRPTVGSDPAEGRVRGGGKGAPRGERGGGGRRGGKWGSARR